MKDFYVLIVFGDGSMMLSPFENFDKCNYSTAMGLTAKPTRFYKVDDDFDMGDLSYAIANNFEGSIVGMDEIV